MNFLNRHLSIRAQLLLLVLAVVLPAAGIFVFFIAGEAADARDAAYAKLNIVAGNTATRLDRILHEQEAVLARIAQRPGVRALDAHDSDHAVGEFLDLHPEFNNLGVRDLRAHNIYSYLPNPSSPQEARDFPWFREGIGSGKFTVGNAFRGRLSGRWVSVLTYPVRDDAGKVSGLVNMSVDLLKLNERVFQQAPRSALEMVLDRDGRFLLRSSDPAAWIGKPLSGPQADAIRDRSAGFFSTRGMDGVQRLHAVATVPGTGWRVFAGEPEDEVFADYRARLLRGTAIGLAALLLVLALAWRIAMAIARPIRELAATAAKIAGGEAASRACIVGPAEIEHVARQFNGMLDALERQREERAALVGHFGHLVRLARDIFLLLGPSGEIVEANAAAIAAYGYSAGELRRTNIGELQTAASRPTWEQGWDATARPGGALFEAMHRRKDGSTFPVEVSAQTIDIDGKRYRQCFIRDISERRAADAQIRRLNRAYATLSESNQAIVRLKDSNGLFPRICAIAVEFGGYVGAWIGLVDASNRRLVPAAVEGKIADYVRQIRVSTDPGIPEGRGPMALALREGRPYYCQDFLGDPATEPWHAPAAQAGIRSMAALPLHRGGAVIGTLNLYAAEAGVFDAPMQALLEEMAVDVSFALDNFEREAARQQAELNLARSEAYYRGLFENMREGLAYCKMIFEDGQPQDFVYLSVNESFGRLTGLKNVAGRKVTEVIPGIKESNPELFEVYGRVASTGQPERLETYLPALDIWFSLSVYRPEAGHFVAVFDNITARKRAEQALREGEERFRGMLEQNVSAMFVIEEGKLAYVNRRAAEILGYSAQELGGRAMLDLVVETDRPGMAEAMRQLLSGEQKTVERAFGALRKDGSLADLGGHAIVATLQGKKVILGMAQDIGERKKTQAEIDRYIGRLEHAMESTLRAVSSMVELRDPYTAGHERRVGEIAAAIGAEMGLDEARVKGLRLAGYVHDIGKISVPAEILSKPSRLTPMELELIKSHCQSGHDVLKDVDFPWPVAEVILQHHERLDGSGYPKQLKDGEIILEARVMAVADVVEAMSSHRPYRPGRGLDAALEEIENNRGGIYDAQVAAACLRLFRDRDYKLPE